jgi:hypothetical protein
MSESERWVLVTWRGKDPSPPPPFQEAFFCPTCGDYFGLAVEDRAALSHGVTVLDSREPIRNGSPIFCPKCGRAYPHYGAIGIEAAEADAPDVTELLVTAFPGGARPSPFVMVGSLKVERFVLLIRGPLPSPEEHEGFAAAAIKYMLQSMVGEAVVGGAAPLNVLAVSSLSDETPWLSRVLNRHVYRNGLGTRLFASVGPIESASGTALLLCAVAPISSA